MTRDDPRSGPGGPVPGEPGAERGTEMLGADAIGGMPGPAGLGPGPEQTAVFRMPEGAAGGYLYADEMRVPPPAPPGPPWGGGGEQPPWDGGGEQPPPGDGNRPWLIALVVLAVLAVIGAGMALYLAFGGVANREVPTTTVTPTTSSATTSSSGTPTSRSQRTWESTTTSRTTEPSTTRSTPTTERTTPPRTSDRTTDRSSGSSTPSTSRSTLTMPSLSFPIDPEFAG